MPATKARRSPKRRRAGPLIDVEPIRLDADGYDSNGAYYGTGQPVFLVTWPNGASQAIRARSITAARDKARAMLATRDEAADPRRQIEPAAQPASATPRRPRARTYSLVWRDWTLAVRQSFPSYAGADRTHLEITVKSPTGAPIPITDTGYRSHFIANDELAAAGGAVAFVTTWLDQEARTKAWAKTEREWRQFSFELVMPEPKAQRSEAKPVPAARRRRQP